MLDHVLLLLGLDHLVNRKLEVIVLLKEAKPSLAIRVMWLNIYIYIERESMYMYRRGSQAPSRFVTLMEN